MGDLVRWPGLSSRLKLGAAGRIPRARTGRPAGQRGAGGRSGDAGPLPGRPRAQPRHAPPATREGEVGPETTDQRQAQFRPSRRSGPDRRPFRAGQSGDRSGRSRIGPETGPKTQRPSVRIIPQEHVANVARRAGRPTVSGQPGPSGKTAASDHCQSSGQSPRWQQAPGAIIMTRVGPTPACRCRSTLSPRSVGAGAPSISDPRGRS